MRFCACVWLRFVCLCCQVTSVVGRLVVMCSIVRNATGTVATDSRKYRFKGAWREKAEGYTCSPEAIAML